VITTTADRTACTLIMVPPSPAPRTVLSRQESSTGTSGRLLVLAESGIMA
jgi:hypothetical protein